MPSHDGISSERTVGEMTDLHSSSRVAGARKKGTKRQREPAEQLDTDGVAVAPTFWLKLFDAPNFFATASIPQFDHRYSGCPDDLGYEYEALVEDASDTIFAHVLQRYAEEISLGSMLRVSSGLFTIATAAGVNGRTTRFGILLEHLAKVHTNIDVEDMAQTVRYFAAEESRANQLNSFLIALLAAFVRIYRTRDYGTLTREPHENLLEIADRAADKMLEKSRRYLRLLGKRGRASILTTGLSNEQSEALGERVTSRINAVRRINAVLTRLFDRELAHVTTARGKRPCLAVFAE